MSLNGTTKWLGLTLAALVAMGSLMVWVGGISADAADTKRRVTNVEQRQGEDRDAYRINQTEIKQDVKEVKSDVQTILRKLEAMEAVQKSERRREQR
jgi:hypothetical protein